MGDIFISYDSQDRARVEQLVAGLRAAGLSVWWDRDVPASAEWEPTIARALDKARCVIVCWTREAVASENVRAEARPARKHGKLIQVFLEGCEPPPFFGERQGVDLSDWRGDRASERFQFLVRGARDVMAGRKPKVGLGYQPKERSGGALVVAAATLAILAGAAVGVMWIPEVRRVIFPPPALVWTVSPGTNIDMRPGVMPDAEPMERINSSMFVLLHPAFATQGGVAGNGVVQAMKLTMKIPGAPSRDFTWLWFTDDDETKGYIVKEGNVEALRMTDGVGGREMLFQPDESYRWNEFMRDIGNASKAGAAEFVIEVRATVHSESTERQISAECRIELDSVFRQLVQDSNAFRSIISPCQAEKEALEGGQS